MPDRYDFVIRGATVYDGTGRPGFVTDLGVAGGRIINIGDLGETKTDVEVEGRGKALAPGFIDVHTHDDSYLLSQPEMTPKVSQGVTTVVVGNCGMSIAPLTNPGPMPHLFDFLVDNPARCFRSMGDYFAYLNSHPAAVNSLTLIGHAMLRFDCVEDLNRPATNKEIAHMQALIAEAMEDGALGMSSALCDPAARAAPTEELAVVAEALTEGDGIYTACLRNEAEGVIDAIEEAAAIGRHAAVQVVISHHKCRGAVNYGCSVETLRLIDRLRSQQRLSLDVYPYIAGSTLLETEIVMMAERTVVAWSESKPEFAGHELREIAAEMGTTVAEAIPILQPAHATYFMMDEADVRRIMTYPHTMIGSDGLPSDSHPHPRLWGTFPRVLGRYVRDLGVLMLADAIRKMTGLPADEFGLKNRGRIAPGYYADLVMFDPLTISDCATYENPTLPAIGIDTVWVNGVAVWRAGQSTGNRPGRVIRRQETNRAKG